MPRPMHRWRGASRARKCGNTDTGPQLAASGPQGSPIAEGQSADGIVDEKSVGKIPYCAGPSKAGKVPTPNGEGKWEWQVRDKVSWTLCPNGLLTPSAVLPWKARLDRCLGTSVRP